MNIKAQFTREKIGTWLRAHQADITVAVIYLLLVFAITYPTIFRLRTVKLGPLYDSYVWLGWWRRFSRYYHLDYLYQPVLTYPFGAHAVTTGFSGLIGRRGL